MASRRAEGGPTDELSLDLAAVSEYDKQAAPRPLVTDDSVITEPYVWAGVDIGFPKLALEQELMCAICRFPVTHAVASKLCMHRFCKECIVAWFGKGNQTRLCPHCKTKHVSKRDFQEDSDVAQIVLSLIPELLSFRADYNVRWGGTEQQLKTAKKNRKAQASPRATVTAGKGRGKSRGGRKKVSVTPKIQTEAGDTTESEREHEHEDEGRAASGEESSGHESESEQNDKISELPDSSSSNKVRPADDDASSTDGLTEKLSSLELPASKPTPHAATTAAAAAAAAAAAVDTSTAQHPDTVMIKLRMFPGAVFLPPLEHKDMTVPPLKTVRSFRKHVHKQTVEPGSDARIELLILPNAPPLVHPSTPEERWCRGPNLVTDDAMSMQQLQKLMPKCLKYVPLFYRTVAAAAVNGD